MPLLLLAGVLPGLTATSDWEVTSIMQSRASDQYYFMTTPVHTTLQITSAYSKGFKLLIANRTRREVLRTRDQSIVEHPVFVKGIITYHNSPIQTERSNSPSCQTTSSEVCQQLSVFFLSFFQASECYGC
jgi:hypothetical protein